MTAVAERPAIDDAREPARPAIALVDPTPGSDPAWRVVARRGVLLLAALLLGFGAYVVWLSDLHHARAQTSLERRFRSELAQGTAPVNEITDIPGAVNDPNDPADDDPPTKRILATGEPIAIVDIAAIGVHEVVVEGSDATALMRGPGHLTGTSLPGQPGTSIVLGRREAFGGPFADLDELARGDEIVVTTGQGAVIYTVDSVTRAVAADSRPFDPKGDALVLVTMDPPLVGSERLIVRATPQSALSTAGTRVPRGRPSAAELGLAGDRSAAAGLLVWVELLALGACGAVWLLLRWRRGPAWLIVTPTLAMLVWLVYEHAARLLPATL